MTDSGPVRCGSLPAQRRRSHRKDAIPGMIIAQ